MLIECRDQSISCYLHWLSLVLAVLGNTYSVISSHSACSWCTATGSPDSEGKKLSRANTCSTSSPSCSMESSYCHDTVIMMVLS